MILGADGPGGDFAGPGDEEGRAVQEALLKACGLPTKP